TTSPGAMSASPGGSKRETSFQPSWWMRNARNRSITEPPGRQPSLRGALADVLPQLVGSAPPLLARVELGDGLEILLVDAGHHAGHDRVLALAALVVLERLHDVVGVLPGQHRVVRCRGAAAVGPMASDAGLDLRRSRADHFLALLHAVAM